MLVPDTYFNRILPNRWSNKLILARIKWAKSLGFGSFFSERSMWYMSPYLCEMFSDVDNWNIFSLTHSIRTMYMYKIDKLQNFGWYYVQWITNLRYCKVTYYNVEINVISHLLYGTCKQENMIQSLNLFVLPLFNMTKRKVICNLLSDTLHISNELLKGNIVFHNPSSLSV